MGCQWQLLLNILPLWLRSVVDEHGSKDLQELRLRINQPPELVKKGYSEWLSRNISKEDIAFCINTATKYSPWTSSSIIEGFITAPGGHRIGVCGECIYDGKNLRNMNTVTSICIRVAREYTGIAGDFYNRKGSILIIGKPGSGKTTFLRDLVRGISDRSNGSVVVLDERREIFPNMEGSALFQQGKRTDVISGCKKSAALEMALRTMSPATIALDEITSQDDCTALISGAWCGVRLIATAHAGNRDELYARIVYKPLLDHGIFRSLVVLHPDQSWQEESIV